jgi:hypothetical protein
MAKLEKMVIIPTIPNMAGVKIRARKMLKTKKII